MLPTHWTAVVNPAAGRGRSRRLVPRLVSTLSSCGAGVTVHVTQTQSEAVRLARPAFERGDGVIACGGDGTVSHLAGVAAEVGGVLAIVPTGSGNDVARELGIDPRRPLHAVELVHTGRVVQVDLGRANGMWFASVASTGFDAEANRWANEVQWLGGTVLYVLAMLRTLATYRPRRFRVSVDGGELREVDAWLAAIGNTPSYGGGMRITPGASIDDGLLDACIVGPLTRADFLRTFPRVFRGTHTNHALVQQMRGRTFDIEAVDGTTPELYASGERVGLLPAHIEVAAGALHVVAPEPAADTPPPATRR